MAYERVTDGWMKEGVWQLQVGVSRLDVWSDGWSRTVEGGASGVGPGVAGVEVGGSERDRGSERESVDEEIVTAVRQGRERIDRG
jgi:hypothetical protein